MNRELPISTAATRLTTNWTNTLTTKQDLTAKAYDPITINKTTTEYHNLPKETQSKIKDVGGFVGGHLKNGKRRKGHAINRSIITLDLDNLPQDTNLPHHLHTTLPFAWLAHTTLSHTTTHPRWRVWVWLTKDITPDQYQPIARRIAWDINPKLDWFDPTTFEPERFFYWPATTLDGDYQAEISNNKPDLDPATVLARYTQWEDAATWPGADPTTIRNHNTPHTGKAEDPREKPGLIGAFNRAYTIQQAINTFLPDVYLPGTSGRYTYKEGNSANGLIIYDNGLRAYSQHATDPASGQNLTSFDLIRVHEFGHLDADVNPDTPINRLPSTKKMLDFIQGDPATRKENAKKVAETIQQVFRPTNTENTKNTENTENTDPNEWLTQLEPKKNGGFTDTITNFEIIFQHDPKLTSIAWNSHTNQLEVTDPQTLPWKPIKPGWTENDEAQLKADIARRYHGLYSPTKMRDALISTASQRAFHPVRDYFNTLPEWDGTPRLNTLLVDYLGAPDTPYTHAVTRKTLVAAHRRTFKPGAKFDQVLTLVGPQGVGKSTIFSKLAGQWFSDNLTITDMKDKTGAEKLSGNLIVEIAELAGMRRVDAENVKGFISRTEDKYRPAYGRTVEHYPRQCILVGSTNSEDGFLMDPTGNRRWWPVEVTGVTERELTVQDLDPSTVDQIWAEARWYDKKGETLYLEGELLNLAFAAQTGMIEADDRIGIVENYLAKPLPANWGSIPLGARRIYIAGGETQHSHGVELCPRETVSKIEIWAECFGREPETMRRMDAREIASIMQKLPGWQDTGTRKRLPLYGQQRIFERTNVPIENSSQ